MSIVKVVVTEIANAKSVGMIKNLKPIISTEMQKTAIRAIFRHYAPIVIGTGMIYIGGSSGACGVLCPYYNR